MKRLTGAWQTVLAVLLTFGAALGLPLVTPDTGLEAPAASATIATLILALLLAAVAADTLVSGRWVRVGVIAICVHLAVYLLLSELTSSGGGARASFYLVLAAAWLMASVAGLLVAIHITTLVHLQPYGHTFYNSLAGGLRGAAYGWVLDYNGSSLRESAQFLDRYLESVAATGAGGRSRPVPVQVCGEPEQVRAAMPRYFEPGVDAADAEFLITAGRPGCVVPRGATVIHTVTRRGTVLGQVVDLRTSRRGARSAPADDYSTISAGLTSP